MAPPVVEKPFDHTLNRRPSVSNGENAEISDDAARLMAMGYQPQMRRDISTLQLIGVAFMVTASWLGVLGGFTTGVVVGGSVCLIYGLIIVGVFSTFFAITLGELASAMPTAGGQYYWVSVLAPRRLSRPSAFFTGLCNLAGGVVATAGSSVLLGNMVLACVKLYQPSFVIHAWQNWLIGLAFNWTACSVNMSKKTVARTLSVGMFISIAVVIGLVISIPATSPKHTDAKFIFTSTENVSGWNSEGMAFLVGLINANYSFGLIDTSVHLAEDVTNPEKTVPKALLLTVAISFFTAWPLAILLMYCLSDFEAIVSTPTGLPLLELFNFAFRDNKAAAVAMLALVAFCYSIAMASLHAYIVHPALNVPIYALILCATLVSILSTLVMASTTAFNSLAAGVIIFPSLTYTLPAIYSLLPSNKHIKGPFNLGAIGTFSKVMTAAFCIFAIVIYSFPYFMPATASNMNYVSAILGIFCVWAVGDWFIYTYPIKSLRGVRLESIRALPTGFAYDRHFMLWDVGKKESLHVGVRSSLCLFTTSLTPEHKPGSIKVQYGLSHTFDEPNRHVDPSPLMVPLVPNVKGLPQVTVTMHLSPCLAFDMGKEYNDWFSDRLGFSVKLLYIGDHRRKVLGNMGHGISFNTVQAEPWLAIIPATFFLGMLKKSKKPLITFADLAAYLVISQKSYDDVNERLPDKEEMDITKFRANIIVSGAQEAYEEDFWAELQFRGSITMKLTQNCARCSSLNVDYATGKAGTSEAGKMLKKLSKDRRVDPGVKWSPVFGRYGFIIPGSSSVGSVILNVGNKVEVTKRNSQRTITDYPKA
ncbi:amino acid polyamine transporter I [Fusarium mexicanum]|uniref:Amino acid polyamine transporter I n=1 Tax=Fusarium mexicanum TaxID=751941 RepID=A0A8H5JGW6_9HYPO|nr:amino acid polyamine transporter I [Fusarium mexicanum]